MSVFSHSLKASATDLPVDSRSFMPNSAAQFYDLAQRAELAYYLLPNTSSVQIRPFPFVVGPDSIGKCICGLFWPVGGR